jgi:hypothetical protein
MKIEEKIMESGLFDFSDGYLGSTNHCVGYYYLSDVDHIDDIEEKGEIELESRIFGEEDWNGDTDDEETYDEFFDKWFMDSPDSEIIEDVVNGGRGYGKIIVDKVNKEIKIMVVPCIWDEKGNEQKIFGFDYDSGELVREISNEVLVDFIENKNGYIS